MTRQRWGGERGSGLVEFALILPLLLVLTVGLLDGALAVWQSNTLSFAVREATRYAIVHGSTSESPVGPGAPSFTAPDRDSVLTGIVRERAVGLQNVTVTSTWPDGTNERGARVVVAASVPYTPTLSQALLGGGLRVTLRAGSEMRIHW